MRFSSKNVLVKLTSEVVPGERSLPQTKEHSLGFLNRQSLALSKCDVLIQIRPHQTDRRQTINTESEADLVPAHSDRKG